MQESPLLHQGSCLDKMQKFHERTSGIGQDLPGCGIFRGSTERSDKEGSLNAQDLTHPLEGPGEEKTCLGTVVNELADGSDVNLQGCKDPSGVQEENTYWNLEVKE
jgi:hypothetical protein